MSDTLFEMAGETEAPKVLALPGPKPQEDEGCATCAASESPGLASEDEDFGWWDTIEPEAVVSTSSDRVAVYVNLDGNIVLRRPAECTENYDPVIVVAGHQLLQLIARLQALGRMLGREGSQ